MIESEEEERSNQNDRAGLQQAQNTQSQIITVSSTQLAQNTQLDQNTTQPNTVPNKISKQCELRANKNQILDTTQVKEYEIEEIIKLVNEDKFPKRNFIVSKYINIYI